MKRTTLIAAASLIAIAATSVIATAHDRGNGERGGPRDGRGGPVVMFEKLDANGDGSITMEEVQGAGAARFAEADANGDGQLSAEEMAAASEGRRAERMADRIAKRIEKHDANGDGTLSLEEATAAAQGSRLEEMFERFDADGDGNVTKAELEQAMEKRGHGRSMKRHGNPVHN